MYTVNIHPQKLSREDTWKKLNYYETSTFMFIGPYQKREQDSCFNCFYHFISSNESDFKRTIDDEDCKNYGLEVFGTFFKNLEQKAFIDHILVINKKNFHFEWKKVRKTPFCSLCASYVEKRQKQSWNPTRLKGKNRLKSKEEITKIVTNFASDLIDPDVGVGLRLFRDAESSVIPMYAIESRMNNRLFFSYGRTDQLTAARNSALLEMLERYSSMVPQFKPPIYGSYKELKNSGYSIVPPDRYILHTPFDLNRRIYWSESFLYGTDEVWLLPEQIMYFDNQLLRDEERFIYETSNGTALGGSVEEALVYAVLEAIERDCFLVHWYLRKHPRLINPLSIEDKNILHLIKTFENLDYEIFLFDITMETDIPTVWILVRNTKKDANLYLYNAAGSHYDPEKAIFAALVEVGTSVIVYEEKLEGEKDALQSLINHPEAVTQMEDHVNYYSFQENASAFNYLFDAIDSLQMVSVKDMRPKFTFTFEKLLHQVVKHHPEIYYTNMSNRLIDEMDLAVVKVFIPTLQPMTFGKQNERINWNRLKMIAKSEEVTVGKEPHPFP